MPHYIMHHFSKRGVKYAKLDYFDYSWNNSNIVWLVYINSGCYWSDINFYRCEKNNKKEMT